VGLGATAAIIPQKRTTAAKKADKVFMVFLFEKFKSAGKRHFYYLLLCSFRCRLILPISKNENSICASGCKYGNQNH
jgi:hypothetical protein